MIVKWRHIIFGSIFILGLLSFGLYQRTPIPFVVPMNWPEPKYDFKRNPVTQEGFELGRKLFYDPLLSRDSTISCASCHLQASGFTHIDHDLSHGIEGRIGTRNSMTLMNLAWSDSFMWDGGVNNLEVQPLNPIESPVEMDESLSHVVQKLSAQEEYQDSFEKAFETRKITGQLVLKALTQFVVMLTSSNSKYDKVMRKEEHFTEQEKSGYLIYRENCAACHKEPLLSSDDFQYNGLPPDPTLNDFGRMKITNKKGDSLKFKVPTLRNIQFSTPYMHDGRFNSLSEVIKHYNQLTANNFLPEALKKPMNLSDRDRVDLLSFLKTLSDKDFLYDQRFSFPKKNN